MDDFDVGVVLSFKASTSLRIADVARTVATGIKLWIDRHNSLLELILVDKLKIEIDLLQVVA
jgi:hypothetical protein